MASGTAGLLPQGATPVYPLLRAEERDGIGVCWEAFLEDPAKFGFTPAVLYADLSHEHILVDEMRACITGIIDWENATIGDPTLDLVGLLGDYGHRLASKVRAAYNGPPDAGMLNRAPFHNAIGPCHEILFGQDADIVQHVLSGLSSLRAAWRSARS